MCSRETPETGENSHDVGRLINTLSHQLKRQMCIREEEDSLTTICRGLCCIISCFSQ